MKHQREVTAKRAEWRFEKGSVRVDAQRRDQRPERCHDLLEDAVKEHDGPSDRKVSLFFELYG